MYFDPELGAWIVSRHADVVAALHDPRLTVGNAPPGSSTGAPDRVPNGAPNASAQNASAQNASAPHTVVRAATTRELSPARLAAWRTELAATARRLADALPAHEPVDLVREFATPWSLAVAATVTGTPPDVAERLAEPARTLFLAAATATDATVAPDAQAAAATLARDLHGASAWPDVQAFVALSQTLPAVLGGAWQVLLGHPAEMRRLRADRGLMPRAVDALLRRAGPSRAVFRRAAADLSLGTARIAAGERVVLRLAEADCDPALGDDALDLGESARAHLAFGRGAHGCPGAPVIRLALAVATDALLSTADDVTRLGDAERIDGFAISVPLALPVVLRRRVGA